MLKNQFISYRLLDEALQYYQEKQYELIAVPWIVDKEAYTLTSKQNLPIQSALGFHVASAEQSFLQLALEKKLLANKKYVACSPCFRPDEEDELHHTSFMKIELFSLGNQLEQVLLDAQTFFSQYTQVQQEKTSEGIDLVLDGREIGSYGVRSYQDMTWTYATGLAEPRFSYLLRQQAASYHISPIAKKPFGSFQKIDEEVQELKDALLQNNTLMSLIELSDIIGAIEGYVHTRFQGSVTLEDLLVMKEATKRAFVSKKRQ